MNPTRIHMIGIGGISMRGLASYLADTGNEITGCDVNDIELPNQPVLHGHDAAHIGAIDEVIINSAITESHPGWVEVEAAKKAGIPVIKRAQKIGEITRGRPTVSISGTHGKSTTTGMVATVLAENGKDPFVMIGARVKEYHDQTYRAGAGPLVLEADEFDRSFLQFTPEIAILTNIEADHLDYYTGGLPEILETFGQFLQKVKVGGRIIANGDDANIQKVLALHPKERLDHRVYTYGHGEQNDYRIAQSQLGSQQNQFDLVSTEGRISINLAVPGSYNQENAAAAFIAGICMGIAETDIARALSLFHGVGMRFEVITEANNITVISDYGHHPTEVAVTVAAAHQWFAGRRIVLVFQPHQFARTKMFFQEFAQALATADYTIVTDIYGIKGREGQQDVSAEGLVKRITEVSGTPAEYIPLDGLIERVEQMIVPGDVVLMMGAVRDTGLDIRSAALEVGRRISHAKNT